MTLTPSLPNHIQNSSFSKINPFLQLGIDSTSLGTFKECPEKYRLSILEGWTPKGESVHLTFGLWVHQAREMYDHARASGATHDDALDKVIDYLLCVTWNEPLGRPWISGHNEKNRSSLLRTAIWYLDKFGANDPIKTVILASGKPAVELSFRFDSTIRASSTGEPFIFCGHLDRLGLLNEQYVIPDIKTTTQQLSPKWFAGFTPGNQFSMYTLAGKMCFAFPVEHLIVDGCQIGVGYTRFQRGIVPRPESVIVEWLSDQASWLKAIEEAAILGHWPKNDKSCGNYGGCPFQEVCSRPPKARETWLKANFVRRIWDPLVARGDV